MTTAIIITFCILLLVAYVFDLTSSKTKIPREIIRANNAVLKRGANSPKESQTLENTGAPETVRSALLYRNALGEVSGLVDVASAQYGDVVGKQLQGYRTDERIE